MARKIVCGIYVVRNLLNGHRYVGSSVNVIGRWSVHRADMKKGKGCTLLQRAWDKYGESNFQFEIIEECDRNQLGAREQYWFDQLKPEYNICEAFFDTTTNRNGGNRTALKNSPEHRAKISASRKGQPGSKGHTGHKHSEETKQKIREARAKQAPPKHTEESKEKIRQSKLGRTASPELRSKLSEAHIGKTASEDTRKKMAKAQRIRWQQRKANTQ